MDLKKPENKSTLLTKITELATNTSRFLKSLLNYYQHKAALLYYWLRNYLRYIKQEKTFDPKYFPEFQPGHIVKVDFGFGIGNEFGGLHYALVLTRSNYKSGTVTVIPLRSLKPNKENPDSLYKTDIYLGTELFAVLLENANRLLDSCGRHIKWLNQVDLNTLTDSEVASFSKQLNEAKKLLAKHDIIMSEVSRLNSGTIAIASQIRTVSKIRIQNPTGPKDTLFNMRVDKNITNKIRVVIGEIYDIK